MRYQRLAWRLLGAIVSLLIVPACALAHTSNACPRPPAGSVAAPPANLYSKDGVLSVEFNYYTTVDTDGRTLFCFVTPDGAQAPTLHVKPGDRLDMLIHNKVPAPPAGAPTEVMSSPSDQCGSAMMTITSLNVHFHGTNTSPACHSDNVIRTLINSNESFNYSIQFPIDEPPGLYWYHPHVHGIAEAALQGGASGAIIVEGMEQLQPAVAGLPERVLVIRDQNVTGNPTPGGAVPSWDLSVNYVPVPYPALTPAVIEMTQGQQEFWRVVNASADSILDLQLVYDGVAQPLHIVALDGVPTGSQDGTRLGHMLTSQHILVPTAGRAEFIVDGPSAGVKQAVLQTLNVDTGPLGDSDPQRPLAVIRTVGQTSLTRIAATTFAPAGPQRFERLDQVVPSANRKLYFSEVLSDPNNPASPTNFFITVDGATPRLFDANEPPAITTRQGSVEEWTIENRTGENHIFHIHQIHFLLQAVNGVPVPGDQKQLYDTYQLPYWSGSGPYPSIKVRMDFRGPDVGDFVYHCHILGHEDNGMMATIRVLPRS
jgi:FtsP/CotA-like multicopper oxidase with cupredoxin domain